MPPTAPRLQFGAAGSLAVSWSTFGPVEGPVLLLGDDPVPAESRTVAGSPTVYHHAAIAGPAPGSCVEYRLAHRGAVGRPRPLRVPEVTAPFRFTASGGHGGTAGTLALATLVSRLSPAFHLHAGDLAPAGTHDLGQPRLVAHDRWDLWLTIISTALADRAPWMPVVGDHDVETGPRRAPHYDGVVARFALPGNGAAGAPTTWWYRFSNLAVVGLDSNDVACDATPNTGYTCGAQDRWLDATLAHLRSDPETDWIVVVFHHSPYATGARHSSDGGGRCWVPILDRHDVDLVINGDTHGYERTHPLRAGAVVNRRTPHPDNRAPHAGTIYLTAGTGGGDDAHRRLDLGSQVIGENGARVRDAAPWSAHRELVPSTVLVDVDPGPTITTMTLRGLRLDGTEIERVTFTRPKHPLAVRS